MTAPVQTAPGKLELVRQFVNTTDVEEGAEKLESPEALRNWLAEHGLETGPRGLTRTELRRAIELREALRALLLANNGEPLDSSALETLNSVAEHARVGVEFESNGGAALSPRAGGVDAALGSLLAIVFGAMTDGTWPRLKACRASTCQWAFYDQSRNRSGHWCTMAVCGNRAKARSYRRRRRATGSRPSPKEKGF